MKFTGPCPKCQSDAIEYCTSVRAGGGPVAVGNFMADAFKIVPEFDGYVCMRCGFTEFYRKT